jgi:hypothetical protein
LAANQHQYSLLFIGHSRHATTIVIVFISCAPIICSGRVCWLFWSSLCACGANWLWFVLRLFFSHNDFRILGEQIAGTRYYVKGWRRKLKGFLFLMDKYCSLSASKGLPAKRQKNTFYLPLFLS